MERIQQTRISKVKNGTDIALVVNAMDILNENTVDTFYLVTSDSDFTPLVKHLKSKGCEVIGVGTKQTNKIFINACTRFKFTETLTVNPPQKSPVKTPKSAPAPAAKQVAQTAPNKAAPELVKLLTKAYQATPQGNGWVLLTKLGQALRQLDAGFRPKNYSHSTLGNLVRAYPDVFEVKGDKAKVYVKLKA